MNDEDWSMIGMVGVVVAFIAGLISFELALLLELLNMAAMMADYAGDH